jgi:hypothetical protein
MKRRNIKVRSYEGKLDYFIKKMSVFAISFVLTGILLCIDTFLFNLSIPLSISPLITALIIWIDLNINERKSYVKINNTEVVYSKAIVFGMIEVKKTFEMKQELIEIIEYYENEVDFMVDCINDLTGADVKFVNK